MERNHDRALVRMFIFLHKKLSVLVEIHSKNKKFAKVKGEALRFRIQDSQYGAQFLFLFLKSRTLGFS